MTTDTATIMKTDEKLLMYGDICGFIIYVHNKNEMTGLSFDFKNNQATTLIPFVAFAVSLFALF